MQSKTKDIIKFLDVPNSPNIWSFLDNHTKSGFDEVCKFWKIHIVFWVNNFLPILKASYSTFRNSSRIPYKWMESLNRTTVKRIESKCRKMMNLFGYVYKWYYIMLYQLFLYSTFKVWWHVFSYCLLLLLRRSSFYMQVYFVFLLVFSRDLCIQKDRLRNQICRLETFTLYVNLSFNITYIHQVDKRLLFQKSSTPRVYQNVAECIGIQQSVSKSITSCC